MEGQLVSVVIPTYKRSDYLKRAIDCVISQTYTNWELLVVDDNDDDSKDREETETFMKRYADDPKVKYLKHNKNKGGGAARNTGIINSTGRYVAFLDDDDEWLPTKLEEQVACFERANDNVAVVYTGTRKVDSTSGSTESGQVTLPEYRGYLSHHLLNGNCVGTTSTVMCKTQVLTEVSFDESLPAAQDWDLYLRLAEKYEFDYVAKPLVIFNAHKGERITKDFEGKVKAHEVLYKKYKTLLEKDRKVHSRFLERQGKLWMKVNNRHRAEKEFARALRTNPSNVKLLARLLLLRVGGKYYGTIRDIRGSFRRSFRRFRSSP